MTFRRFLEDRWPRHTMKYNPARFSSQMLIVIVVELAVLIVLVAV